MSKDEQVLSSLRHVRDLETFLHNLFESLDPKKLRHGESVLPYCEKSRIPIPDSLHGIDMTWDTDTTFESEFDDQPALVLVRPGRPDILGLKTIGCVRIGRFKVCLECGWLWCRIVIKGRFVIA